MKKSLITLAILGLASGVASAQVANASSSSAVSGATFANSGGFPGGTYWASSVTGNTSAAQAAAVSTPFLGGISESATSSSGYTNTDSGVTGVGTGGAGSAGTQQGQAAADATGGTLSLLSPPFGTAETTSTAAVGSASTTLSGGYVGSAESNTWANANNLSNAEIGPGGLSSAANSAGAANLTTWSTTTGIGQSASANGYGFIAPNLGAVQTGSGSVTP